MSAETKKLHNDDENGKIDWMCVFRYVLLGAVVGGAIADMLVSPNGISVYTGAALGGALGGALKLMWLDSRH